MSAGKSIVLEEKYDANYKPTEEEVIEYAEFLGLNLPDDEELLWVAIEGLKAPLPSKWKPCKSAEDEVYYFNFSTGESAWEHPCDQYYKALFQQEKKKLQRAKKSSDTSKKKVEPDQKKEVPLKLDSALEKRAPAASLLKLKPVLAPALPRSQKEIPVNRTTSNSRPKHLSNNKELSSKLDVFPLPKKQTKDQHSSQEISDVVQSNLHKSALRLDSEKKEKSAASLQRLKHNEEENIARSQREWLEERKKEDQIWRKAKKQQLEAERQRDETEMRAASDQALALARAQQKDRFANLMREEEENHMNECREMQKRRETELREEREKMLQRIKDDIQTELKSAREAEDRRLRECREEAEHRIETEKRKREALCKEEEMKTTRFLESAKRNRESVELKTRNEIEVWKQNIEREARSEKQKLREKELKELKEMKEALSHAQLCASNLQQEKVVLETKINSLLNDQSQHEQIRKQMENDNQNLKTNLEKSGNEKRCLEIKIEALIKAQRQVDERTSDHTRELQELQFIHTQMESEMENIRNENQDLVNNIQTLKIEYVQSTKEIRHRAKEAESKVAASVEEERESRRREKDEFETRMMNLKSEKEMLMHNVEELRKQLESRELQIQKQTSKLNQMEAFRQELKQKEQELMRETMTHRHEKETQRSRDRHNIDLGDLIRLDSDKDSHDEDVSDDSEPDAFVDLSEMSESTIADDDIDSSSSERWSSRVDTEEAALQNAVSYCEHQRRTVNKLRKQILREQHEWRRDHQSASKHSGSRKGLAEQKSLRRRKQQIEDRSYRLNTEIHQYRDMKRCIRRKQRSLEKLRRQVIPGSKDSLEDTSGLHSRPEGKPDTFHIVERDSSTQRWDSSRRALQQHSGWLRSFSHEVQRAAERSSALSPPTSARAFQPTMGAPPAFATSAFKQPNDITIRIKVEQ